MCLPWWNWLSRSSVVFAPDGGVVADQSADVAAVLEAVVCLRVADAGDVHRQAGEVQDGQADALVREGHALQVDDLVLAELAGDAVDVVVYVIDAADGVEGHGALRAEHQAMEVHRRGGVLRHDVGVAFQQDLLHGLRPHVEGAHVLVGLDVHEEGQAAVDVIDEDAALAAHDLDGQSRDALRQELDAPEDGGDAEGCVARVEGPQRAALTGRRRRRMLDVVAFPLNGCRGFPAPEYAREKAHAWCVFLQSAHKAVNGTRQRS